MLLAVSLLGAALLAGSGFAAGPTDPKASQQQR